MDIGIKVDYGRKARSITAGYKQSREEAGLLIPRKRYSLKKPGINTRLFPGQ